MRHNIFCSAEFDNKTPGGEGAWPETCLWLAPGGAGDGDDSPAVHDALHVEHGEHLDDVRGP